MPKLREMRGLGVFRKCEKNGTSRNGTECEEIVQYPRIYPERTKGRT